MPEESPSRSRGRVLRALLLWIVPPLALGIGAWFWFTGGRYASTDDAYVQADKTVVAAEVAGRVRHVAVAENEPVAAGQLLLELDTEALQLVVSRASAQAQSVRMQLAGLEAEYQEKVTELAVAKQNADYAAREEARWRELAARRLAPTARLDDAAHVTTQGRGSVAVLERELTSLAVRLNGAPRGAAARHPDVLTAEAELARAELELRRARILAPRAGIVSRLPKVGDHLGAGEAALAIVAGNGLWIEANFKETDLARVRPGQSVEIRIDTYGRRRWQGRVESISPATGSQFALLPPQNASGNWVKVVQRVPVRITLYPGDDDPPLRIGMSANARIDTGPLELPTVRTAHTDP